MAYETISVAPIAGALGAEVSGVDLARKLPDATIAEIRQALLTHLVIFFRDQHLTPEQHLALGRRFGPLQVHDFVEAMPDYPEILEVRKEPEETRNFGGGWHTDVSYLERPSLGSLLYALEAPEYGGDTLFANQYLAYETLSDGMKQMLDGLTAMHSARRPYRTFTLRFRDMTEAESAPLLNYLCDHAVRPEFTCRFRWQPGSLAFWDNRAVQHNAINDYHGRRRLMHRVTIEGERPV